MSTRNIVVNWLPDMWFPNEKRATTVEAARDAAKKANGYARAGWSLLDQGLVSGVNFLTVLLFARSMSPQNFGLLMLAQTGLLAVTALQNALVTQPHNLLAADLHGASYARLTNVLGAVQLLAGLVMTLILLLGAWWLHSVDQLATAYTVLALALIIVPWTAQEFVRRVLYTRSDARRATINDVVAYGLQLIGVIWLVYAAPSNLLQPHWALAIFGVSSLLAVPIGLLQLRTQLQVPMEIDRTTFIASWRQAWQLSRWLCAQQIVIWLGANAQGWLLAALLGVERFGLYRAAYQIVNVLNPLRQAVMNYLPSRASRTFTQQGMLGLHAWLRHTTAIVAVPFGVLSLLLAVAAPMLLQLAYGSAQGGVGAHISGEQLQWVVVLGALSAAITMLRTPLEYATVTIGGAQALFVRALLAMLLVLTLGVTLIYYFDIYGAVLSEVLVATLVLLMTWHIYKKHRIEQQHKTDIPQPTIATLKEGWGTP